MKNTFINFRNINTFKKNSGCYLYFKIVNCTIKIDRLTFLGDAIHLKIPYSKLIFFFKIYVS